MKFAITTYPRKGTETFFNHTILLINQITTYPPQGDGNLMRMSFPYFLPSITIYPRKGTVTDAPGYGCRRGQITTYPRKGTKKHLCHWRLPAAEVLCFFLYSILQVGSCACRNRLCDRQRLDALRDVPLQGADLMQVDGDLLQGIFNVLGIQRQNALALQA